MEVDLLGDFLSHLYATSPIRKYVALLVIYNGDAAIIVAKLCSCIAFLLARRVFCQGCK